MIWEISVWVVVALVAALIVGFWVYYIRKRKAKSYWSRVSPWYAIGSMLWAPVAGLFALFLLSILFDGIAGIGTDFTPDRDEKVGLAALATNDSIEGNLRGGIFLTVGHIDGKRVISFVSKRDDGGYEVGQVDGSESIIYEKPDETSMTIHHWEKVNPFWVPWVLERGKTYTFVVPEGSVVNTFEVSP